MSRITDMICEALFDLFRANPAYVNCNYLAYSESASPDISSFFEDMKLYSESVYFPVCGPDGIVFSGAEEDRDAVLFVPSEAVISQGDLHRRYKEYISSHKNIIRSIGVCEKKDLPAGRAPEYASDVVDVIVTEDGVSS